MRIRDYSRRLAAIAILGLGVFLAASCLSFDIADWPTDHVVPVNAKASNWCGVVGASVASFFVELFGITSLGFAITAIAIGVSTLLHRGLREQFGFSLGLLLLTVALAAMIEPAPMDAYSTVSGPGGTVGAALLILLRSYLSTAGAYILLTALLCAGIALTVGSGSGWLARRMVAGSLAIVAWLAQKLRRPTSEAMTPTDPISIPLPAPAAYGLAEAAESEVEDEGEEEDEDEAEEDEEEEGGLRIVRTGLEELDFPPLAPSPPTRAVASNVELPELDILNDSEPFEFHEHEQAIRERARVLEKTFSEFQMKVKVVQIDTGPVVTQYEIELEPGLRARRVMALSDDIAIALKAPSVRIVAPIPGKNTVGIEVPNEKRAKVCLKEVMLKAGPATGSMRLPMFLGKDVKGQPMVHDLATMPHLLIAGRTGTGKSVCLNTLILSVLMTRTPDQVKMLMIDPKMVELSLYKSIPHLMHPVVTDMKKAEAILAWAVEKMEERYSLLARVGVRHIDSYNAMSHEEILEKVGVEDEEERSRIPSHMPYILIFADEMADLMMTSAKEVESHIIRLAQKSRAVGIHLILATQKPTVDVITGLIKSNLPARIAFQVASRTDSRVVLDEMGADKLLGNGDMLFLYPGTSKISRAQGTFVSDAEVTRVVEYLSSQAKPQFSEEIVQFATAPRGDSAQTPLSGRDDMYEAAIEVVIREQRGSVSLLQRALGIGYGRAARLIDYMAEDGIVGEYQGAQAREVLYQPEQWEDLRKQRFAQAG